MSKLLTSVLCLSFAVTASAGNKVVASVVVDGPTSYSMYTTAGKVELSEVLTLCEEVDEKLSSGWITLGGAIWDTETNTCKISTTSLSTGLVNGAMLKQVESGKLSVIKT
jgi:hypothetical protein